MFSIFLIILLAVLWLFLSINPLISSNSSHTENSVNLGSSKHTCSMRPRISKKEIKFLDNRVLGSYFSALLLVNNHSKQKDKVEHEVSIYYTKKMYEIFVKISLNYTWALWPLCLTEDMNLKTVFYMRSFYCIVPCIF